MRPLLVLAAISILAGALAGLFAPRPSEAAVINYSLRVHPAATSSMTCGWHSSECSAENAGGPALDWDNGDTATVYWRSYGWCSIGPCSVIAKGTISKAVPFCTETRVSIKDTYGRAQQMMVYTHTNTSQSGQQFDINGSTSYAGTTVGVGSSLTQESGGCNSPYYFRGSHVHEWHSGTGWTKNTSKYPKNAPATGSYPLFTTLGWHQVSRGWTITF
jgi:hypothetical protein